MKVLLTTDTYTPTVNGVVFSTLLLKDALERLGHEVRVLTLSSNHHSHRDDAVYYIASFGVGKVYPDARVSLHKTRRFLEEILAWGPEVIHSQQEFSSFSMARYLSKRSGAPLVHTYHTAYEDYTHYFSPSVRLGKRMVSILSRRVSRAAACLIAPSQKIKTVLDGYGMGCPVEVIPTGVDLQLFQGDCDPQWRRETRAQLGIPEDGQVLVYLGRLAKEKKIDQLMDLLASAGRTDFSLLIVGDGPIREKLEEKGRKMPYRVAFAGPAPHVQIRDYYQLGDLFVTASISETQGLTYFEALAAGVPVLCRRDECVEQVILNGVNGWQYDTAEAFQVALHRFCGDADLRRQLSRNARLTVERFSADAFGRAVADLYRRVTRETPAALMSPSGVR